jgi:hypothetical protein
MKTPREILLERHRAVEPKLDAIRREVITDELNNPATKEQRFGFELVSWFIGRSKNVWQELILPSRRVWAGLTAIWILIVAVNFSLRDSSPAGKISAAPVMMMSFQEQQRMLNEIFADRSQPSEADRPKNFPVKPRTETIRIFNA